MGSRDGILEPGTYFMRGNDACVEGALIAGCRFFGGYPITPSNEISALMARKLPLIGGVFIQFEDEIASIMGVIGAANAGVKSMTATSGPGFSLMQEAIGLAYMIETPIVIVNVQRGGPSTGLPTQVGQGDFLQTHYGSHGDYMTIVYLPNSPQEMFDMIIKAFNAAWTYRVPTILLSDQMVGHMIERVVIPSLEDILVVDRVKPDVDPEKYLPFDSKYLVPPMAVAGEGYRVHLTGLAHDERGYPTTDPETVSKQYERMAEKIRRNEDRIIEWEEYLTHDAELIIVAFGITSRSALKAVKDARRLGYRVGLFRLKTGWPFPWKPLTRLAEQGCRFLVVEINAGQVVRIVREYIPNELVYHLPWHPGSVPPPEIILKKIREVFNG